MENNFGVTTQANLQEKEDKRTLLEKNKAKLLTYINDNLIGSYPDTVIQTVYGEKPLIYADYTASGKSLKFIEEYIQNQVLPMYANSHSLQSGTGKQTIRAREEARQIIKRCCNADEFDLCIFTGNGSTSATNLLIDKLRIKEMVNQVQNETQVIDQKDIDEKVQKMNFCEQNRWHSYDCKLCKVIVPSLGAYEKHAQSDIHKLNLESQKNNYKVYTEKPVILLSIFEHNSNLIPWRETGAQIELIPMTETGDFDYVFLQEKLAQYKNRNSLKVGSFIAGSNITGTMFDVDRLAVMCHKSGFLACFDYAATCPYNDINMNGVTYHGPQHQSHFQTLSQDDSKLAYKDAVFLSPHKLVGGPGSSGVLVAKRNVIASSKPSRLGGGIVFFVNEMEHEFLADKQEREESGTPGIIQDIRAGLAFQLKESVGCKTIAEREETVHKLVLERLGEVKNLFLLGNNELPKVCIYTFIIKSKCGKILHPNFVCQLLNDMFGIQSRAGCQCSAMYGQKILGIDLKLSREYKEALMNGQELLRMGFTRVNFSYFMPDETIQYIIDAIEFIAKYGWMMLPHYKFDQDVGNWINRDEYEQKQRSWLGEIDYSQGKMSYLSSKDPSLRGTFPFFQGETKALKLDEYKDLAKQLLLDTVRQYKNIYGKSMVDQKLLIPEEYQQLIWFLFPSEVLQDLLDVNINDFEGLDKFNRSVKPQEAETWQTPYKPRDYNKQKFAFEFSTEYNETHNIQPDNKSTDSKSADSQHEEQKVPIESEKIEQDEENEDEYGEEFPFNFGDDLTQQIQEKPAKIKLMEVPKDIKAQVGAAIRDFEMIKDGDRVLIALSGGKDSLCLIHILKYFQSVAPIKFEIGAVTIDPMVNEYKPQPLLEYMKSIGVPYWIESDAIIERAKDCMQKNSICSFCSRMKRGMIYNCARREKYNVIAMGQHLDDLAESFVMSAFHNGALRTMKANYTIDQKDLRVIRPLVTCREALFKNFSNQNNLPVIADNCPACFSEPKERHRIKLMLAQQEHLFPSLFQSILKTITPLMRGNLQDGFLDKQNDDEEEFFTGPTNCENGKCPL